MSFPSTSVLDTFNRANSGTLGANWTPNIWGAGATDISIDANRAAPSTLFTNLTAWWNPATFGPDSEAYVTYPVGAAGWTDGEFEGFTTDVYLLLRIQSPGSSAADGYALFSYDDSFGYTGARIYRMDNGVMTTLGADFGTAVIATGEKRGLSASGSTLAFNRNTSGTWSEVGTRTDSTYGSAGYVGIGSARRYVDAVVPAMDDFGGGTISAPGGIDTFRTDRIRSRRTSW